MKKRSAAIIGLEQLRSSQFEISRHFNRAVIDCPIPLIIHDEHERTLQMSKGWTRFSGYTMSDIPTIGDWRQRAYGAHPESNPHRVDELFKTNETADDGEW